MIQLQDKIALVTGSARGIGAEIARSLADAGCHVVVSDIDESGANQTAEQVKAKGRRALVVKADVSEMDQAMHLIEATVKEFGRLDILVNNAGITRDNLLIRMKEAEWDAVIKVNLKGTFNCIKASTKTFMKQRTGKIINLASVVGVMGNVSQANYSASKAGVIGLTKSVAKELGARNIKVNALAPGYIETEMTKSLSDTAKDAFMTAIPLKRAGIPKDVANAVLFLSSDLSDYITGQVLNIDGGMVM
ncbi:MAG: 3-oxoacyl-[acyl-carrier-protein] reductase [candidate division KSB1 bacterium]|nr:3-oxoacyl-[acyl-carrier-protein] reductase [candidate division KSB1 bacterium]